MKKNYYITTPIYYVNDKPHIGHYYCNIMADTLARFHRLLGEQVMFVTGTDENSQKILPVAKEKNIPPLEYAKLMSDRWLETWEKLDISFNKFIRTTSEEHHKNVKKLFKKSYEKGDIYKKKYSGLYCVGCEKFYKKSELTEDGLCPYHKTKPEIVEEENYFFKLSKYEKELLNLFENPDFLIPQSRRSEMINFIKSGLEDVSISRSSVDWGIPLPIDKSHVFYVWYDALINYLTALNFHDDNSSLMADFWSTAIHLVGKDIVRFHSVMWPAMLLSAGVPVPKQIAGHGFFTVNGEKISKSLGNAIDPITLSKKYDIDSIRFYMLFSIPFGKDSNFSIKQLEEQYVSFLSNDLGNLLNRTLNMIQKYNNSTIIRPKETQFKEIQNSMISLVNKTQELYDSFKFDELIKEGFKIIKSANTLIDTKKPWALNKNGEQDVLQDLLYTLFEILRLLALILFPIMPHKMNELWNQLGLESIDNKLFEKMAVFGLTESNHKIKKGEPLFPKIEIGETAMTEETKNPEIKENEDNIIEFGDFAKVELVVAQIKTAEKIENADKLLKLTIDIGDEIRTLAAGIAMYYKPEELLDKKIIVVKNLKPRKLRGVLSQGMLLAARDGDKLALLTVSQDVAPGSKVS